MSIRHSLVTILFLISFNVYAAPYDTVVSQLRSFEKNNPGLAQVIEVAKNDQGTPIYALRINKPYGTDSADKAAQLVVGTHHGNEVKSVDIALQFIKDILENLKSPTESAFKVFEEQTFYVLPVLNVSGYNKAQREELNKSGQDVDSNRDYPDPCGNPSVFQLASTRGLAKFIQDKNVIAAVTIHGYIGTFTYPWGTFTTNPRTADEATYKSLGLESTKENGYDTGTHAELIYPTVGAFEDWAYHSLGVWTMLLEIANFPDVSSDSKSLLRFFSLVPKQRSTQHAHTGKCKKVDFRAVRARP